MVHGLVLKSARCCVRANVRYSIYIYRSRTISSDQRAAVDTGHSVQVFTLRQPGLN